MDTIGGPNLRYVRVEPPLAQCLITAPVAVFGCACSECPSFFSGDNDNIYTYLYLFYDCFRGPIDGSHLDMLYHMMT